MQTAALAAALAVFSTGARAAEITAYARINPTEQILFPSGADGQEHAGHYKMPPVPLLSPLDDFLARFGFEIHWPSALAFAEWRLPETTLALTLKSGEANPIPAIESASILNVPNAPPIFTLAVWLSLILVFTRHKLMNRRRRRKKLEFTIRKLSSG